jgi:FkbM family methyltransferase
MSIDLKRKLFLEKLEKSFEKIKKFEKFSGPGLMKKVKRLFFTHDVYVVYLWHRFSPFKKRKIRLFWGKTINMVFKNKPPSFSVAGVLLHKGEYKLTKFFIKNLKETDIFYDVGASYGFYTYLALEFCKEVHSFEPLPDVFENLKMNLENIENVFLNQVALSDKNGKTKIYLPVDNGFSSSESSTIIESLLRRRHHKFSDSLEIGTITLDNYLKNHNKPTVIKLDVEGAENIVIEGGYEFFKNNSPIIAMEVWSSKEGGEISMKAVEKLRELGYKSYLLNENGDLKLVGGNLPLIVDQANLYADNFIFKKQ